MNNVKMLKCYHAPPSRPLPHALSLPARHPGGLGSRATAAASLSAQARPTRSGDRLTLTEASVIYLKGRVTRCQAVFLVALPLPPTGCGHTPCLRLCSPPWSVNGALGAQEQRAWNQADCVCLWGQGPVPTASERGLWFPRRDSQREGWGRQRCGHQGTWVQTPTGDSASFWKAPHLRFPTCSVERTMLLRALPGLVPGLPRRQRCGGRSGISAWQLSGPPNHLRARELALLGGERGEPLPSHLGLEGSGMGVGRRRWFPLWLRPPDMLGRPRTFLPSGPQFPHL